MDDLKSIEALIDKGESQTLEFKSAIPKPEHLARLIASFANSNGGTVLLGVRDDGSIPGVSIWDSQKALAAALEKLEPQPEALLTELLAGLAKRVARIDVAKEPRGPVIAPDGAYVRAGVSLKPLPASSIKNMVAQSGSSNLENAVEPLARSLQKLTERILELEQQIVSSQKWRRRLPDMILGAVISALLGLVLALLFLR